MKHRWLAALLAVVLLMAVEAPVYAATLSKAELYDAAKTELEKYLNDEASMSLDDLFIRFSELGSYEMSMEFTLYTNVLCSIEKEDYSLTYVFIGILRQSEAFNAYLEEAQVYGTLDDLECYAHGRQAEMMGDMQAAFEYYNSCLSFMDSTQRVSTQLVAELEEKYQEALEYFGMSTLEGYEKAYELFGELARYNYANSAALMSTSETLWDALLSQMKPTSVCGICGAEEECACVDILFELQAQLDYIRSLLNSGQCTGMCLVHCDDKDALEKIKKKLQEPAYEVNVNDSAIGDGQVCRICAKKNACNCSDLYLDVQSQAAFIRTLLNGDECSGSCPLHCAEKLFVVIVNSSANVRSGPGSNYEKIGTALFGEVFPYLGEVDNWYKIRAYGQVAYVVKNLSAQTNDPDAMPAKPLNAGIASKPASTPAATSCAHSSTRKEEGPRVDYENGEWLQECYKICNNCNEVVDIFYRGGVNIEAIPTE